MKHLPNFLTMTNLFSGCCAVVSLFAGQAEWVLIFVLISGIADFFDGMVARAVGASGPLGVQLDSLADMVSFGFLPGALVYFMIKSHANLGSQLPLDWYAIPAFLITVFSAGRLAKFNIDENQTQHFIGLNTPSNTLFVVGLWWLDIENMLPACSNGLNCWYIFIAISCYLLVSPIRMFGFKLKSLTWGNNKFQYIFLLGAIILVLTMGKAALSLCIIWYVITSFGYHLTTNKD